jgi:hypothetical protein
MPRWAAPELVAAARAGDAEAVERLVSAIWPRCFRLAATLIGERGLAEDVRLDVAERYASPDGSSVLVGDQYLPTVWRLASASKPLLDNRVIRFRNFTPVNQRIIRTADEPSSKIAVPADGVRAIAAVLRARENRAGCRCEIVFHQRDGGTYRMWKIPLAPSARITKYVVDASTLAVRAER